MFRQTNLAFYRKDDALILCEQPINLFVIYFSLKTRMVKLKKKKNRGLFFLIFFFKIFQVFENKKFTLKTLEKTAE